MSPGAIDWDDLKTRVLARTDLADLVGRAGVALKRQGRRLTGLCPFHVEHTGSFTVFTENRPASFHCFGCGAHGDAIDFVKAIDSVGFKDAVRRLAEASGETVDIRETPEQKAARQKRQADERAAREAARLEEGRRRAAWLRASAGEIWQGAKHDVCLARYYQGRGIDTDAIAHGWGELAPGGVPVSLRFHPDCPDFENKAFGPAQIAAITVGGDVRHFSGVHRTFLTRDLSVKRAFAAKMMLCEAWGGVVRLTPIAKTLILAEGIETSMALMAALAAGARRPLPAVWAALSLGNVGGRGWGATPDLTDPGIQLPTVIDHVIIAEDADNKDPRSADAIYARGAARFGKRGRRVSRIRPTAGMDFNDMLRRQVPNTLSRASGEVAA